MHDGRKTRVDVASDVNWNELRARQDGVQIEVEEHQGVFAELYGVMRDRVSHVLVAQLVDTSANRSEQVSSDSTEGSCAPPC